MNVFVGATNFQSRVNLIKASASNPDALESIADAGAAVFEAGAKALVRVESGDLRDSIHRVTLQKTSAVARVGVVPGTDYALREEFGHSLPTKGSHGHPVHQAPHPYMRPAYDTKQDDARAAMVDQARTEIGKLLDR